jgi:hypothetical protein
MRTVQQYSTSDSLSHRAASRHKQITCKPFPARKQFINTAADIVDIEQLSTGTNHKCTTCFTVLVLPMQRLARLRDFALLHGCMAYLCVQSYVLLAVLCDDVAT